MTWQAPDLPGADAPPLEFWGRCWGCRTFGRDLQTSFNELLCGRCRRLAERFERGFRGGNVLDAALEWALGILEAPEDATQAYARGAALGAGIVGLLWALVELGRRVAG